ncbi:MAG TPA: hypothetical protein VFB63_01505 [Bryobacteraceae bacterium]|nr:hypothetical protein [Bryobacteraceae bacterium]
MTDPEVNLPAEIEAADKRLAINNTNLEMPLDHHPVNRAFGGAAALWGQDG